MLSSRDVYGKITLHKEYYTPADRVTEAVHAVPRKDNINLNAHTPHAHRDVPARVQGPNTEHKPATARSTGKKIVAGGRNSCIQDPDILEKSRKHRPPKPVKNSERPPWYPLRKDDRIGKHDLAVVGPERKSSQQIELQRGQDALLLSSLRVEPGKTAKRPGRGRKLPKPPTEHPEDLPEVFQRLTNPKYYTASHKYRFMPEEEPDLEEEGVPSGEKAKWWKKDKEPTGPEEMPSVYDRLTNPKYFTSTHKHRFTKDGVGRGIDGRRDDDTLQNAIAGKAQITRESDVEMDAPNQPTKTYKKQASTRPRSKKPISSQDAYTDKVMTEGVFSRLYKPAYTDRRPEGEHDAKIKTLKQFNVVKDVIPRWQSGL